jgi:glutathione S-transferase
MSQPDNPVRLYRHPLSGHSHRVELYLSVLGLPAELVDVDLRARAQKAPEFLRKNPFGQVPVLEDGAIVLGDSAAILTYLALRYDEDARFYPRDALGRAHVARWFAVAAGELRQGPGLARLHGVFGAPVNLERAHATAAALFAVLEAELAGGRCLVGEAPTLADFALYAYTAHAPEGGISLTPYPNIRDWLARIEALPGFVPMPRTQTAIHA